LSEIEIIHQFREAMAGAGLRTDDDIGPSAGEVLRFHVEGDAKGSRNGWYVLFLDNPPAGEFGCWKRGVTRTWFANGETLTQEQSREAQQRIEAARRSRAIEERNRQREAAKLAQDTLRAAVPADDSHPYLQRKGIPAHDGMRIGSWLKHTAAGDVFRVIDNALLVPVMDASGAVVSVQAIFPDKSGGFGRDKDFLREGKKRGCFFMIGTPVEGSTIAICEGYATGATIHRLTGWCVVVAFDAYNLPEVAKALRKAHPGAHVVVCADNDQWTETPVKNPGVTKANEAASGINARVIAPQFADLDGAPTDFNDLEQREGADVARSQLMAHMVAADGNDSVAKAPSQVDLYAPFPDMHPSTHKPLPTTDNVAEAMRRIGVVARYNVMRKDEEYLIPGEQCDHADDALNSIESACARMLVPPHCAARFASTVARRNKYSPVVTWVKSKPWDGISRLDQFYATITPATPRILRDGRLLHQVLMLRWMISAIAAAFNPRGVEAQGVLVLQGEQYLGKTQWFKSLTPESLGLAKDGMSLSPDSRDSVMSVMRYWLVELGEIDATFKKSDIAAMKAFITSNADTFRAPYARKAHEHERRTVFFGSVNPRQFLHDQTGNRRFWTIECEAINTSHGLDMQQVWTEVHDLYQRGESHFLTHDEMAALNSSNEEFQVTDPTEERLQTGFDWQAEPLQWSWETVTDALRMIGLDKPTKAETIAAGRLIRKMNGGNERKSNGARLVRLPPLMRETRRGPF
jgi:putative DNA primase/helicase